jgi:hypothetical protein
MTITFRIELEEIFKQIKFSCQIPELIKDITIRLFIRESAKILGIKVTKQDLQMSADNFRLYHNLLTFNSAYDWLKHNYLTLAEFEEMSYDNVLLNKLAIFLFSEHVESYFNEKILDYFDTAIYQIVLENSVLAMQLYEKIKNQEISFYEVSQQYIKDTELRRRGGYLGRVKMYSLHPEIVPDILASKPPQLLKPIITSDGVYLIRVEEVIKPQLDNDLRYQILLKLFNNWLKDELSKVNISSNLPRKQNVVRTAQQSILTTNNLHNFL